MTVWRHTNVPEAGYADVLSGAIERVQRANPDTFWPVSDGLQLVASDYSGQHRGASHEIYAFLVTPDVALEPLANGARGVHCYTGSRMLPHCRAGSIVLPFGSSSDAWS